MSNKRYVTTGLHAIEEYLKSDKPGKLVLRNDPPKRISVLVKQFAREGMEIISLSREAFLKLVIAETGGEENQGGLLIGLLSEQNNLDKTSRVRDITTFISTCPRVSKENALVLLLDGITDPHNLGAILRVADQLQVDGVVLPERRAARVTETVSRVSAGADQYVTVIEVTNLARTIKQFQEAGFWVYGTDMKGQALQTIDFKRNVCLVMGSEGKGIGTLLEKTCDQLVAIPTKGHIDSLNVSVAAGISCYEIRRQQDFPFL